MSPSRRRSEPFSQQEPAEFVPTHTSAAAEPPITPTGRRRLTREARALLRQADEGGVPMFVSQSLRRIARENGVDVSEDMTPNAIVEALRARAAAT